MTVRTTFDVLMTDQLFKDSPDVGDPACLCSRCLKPILDGDEEDAPIVRAWPDAGGEYRYHPRCVRIVMGRVS